MGLLGNYISSALEQYLTDKISTQETYQPLISIHLNITN